MRGAVARGALAGLAGGAAMAAAERLVLPRLPDRHRQGTPPWDARVARLAGRAGWRMSPGARSAAGVATQLLLAAALGAGYAAAARAWRPSRAGRQLLEAGLVFGASLLAPELPNRKRRRRSGGRLQRARRETERRVLDRVSGPRIFGTATTLALRALAG